MDVTWHVRNGCNDKGRARRAGEIDFDLVTGERYFYKGLGQPRIFAEKN